MSLEKRYGRFWGRVCGIPSDGEAEARAALRRLDVEGRALRAAAGAGEGVGPALAALASRRAEALRAAPRGDPSGFTALALLLVPRGGLVFWFVHARPLYAVLWGDPGNEVLRRSRPAAAWAWRAAESLAGSGVLVALAAFLVIALLAADGFLQRRMLRWNARRLHRAGVLLGLAFLALLGLFACFLLMEPLGLRRMG